MDPKIQNPMDYHAALYIRLSKEDENEGPSESITNQKSLLNAFVRQQGLSVYDTYVDDGWSGTSFDRPGFQRMIGEIEAGNVNMVITKDLSRLGRDYILTGHYMERYFPEKRVRYISLLDGIDTGMESVANDITPFRAIMNDMYARDISRKIKSVKRDKQRKGQFIGGKPVYGYRMHPTEKNKIVIDEEAAAVVRRIFAMALEGMSCRKIAEALNADEVPTPARYAGLSVPNPGRYTGLWSGERISEILQNEIYIGSMVQGRSVKISYKSRKCRKQPRDKWIVVEGTHEPLIDREMFQKVQMLIRSRRHTRSRTYDFLLKGMIFCHECGSPLAVLNRKNAAGEDVLYFVCRTYQRFTGAGVCTCHSIRERAVTEAVLTKIREIWEADPKTKGLQAMAETFLAEAGRSGSPETELRQLRRKQDRLTANLDQMYADRLAGLLEEADFVRLYRRTKEELRDLEQKRKSLEKKKQEEAGAEGRAEKLVRQFRDTISDNKELMVSLIARVELTEDKEIRIQFRFREPEAISLDPELTTGAAESIAH